MLVYKGLNLMKMLPIKKQYNYQVYMQVKISYKYLKSRKSMIYLEPSSP